MILVYIFCVVIGVLFAALSWLRVGAPAADGEEPRTAGLRRRWALPLAVVGLVGLTLHLLDRTFVSTMLWSVLLGAPLGLVADWVGQRVSGDKPDA